MYTRERTSSNRATPLQPAQPCVRCGTTGGRSRSWCYRPVRILGMCENCHQTFSRHEGRGKKKYRPDSLPATPPEPEPGDPTTEEIAAACEQYREKRFRMPTGHGARMRQCSKIHRLRMGGRR